MPARNIKAAAVPGLNKSCKAKSARITAGIICPEFIKGRAVANE